MHFTIRDTIFLLKCWDVLFYFTDSIFRDLADVWFPVLFNNIVPNKEAHVGDHNAWFPVLFNNIVPIKEAHVGDHNAWFLVLFNNIVPNKKAHVGDHNPSDSDGNNQLNFIKNRMRGDVPTIGFSLAG